MPPFCELLCQPRSADLLCTTSTPRVLPGGAFAHLIRIRRFRVPFLLRTWGTPSRAILRDTASRSPSWMLTYVSVRSGVAIRAKLQESRSKERLSFCLRAVAPFPHKVSSLRCGTLWGPQLRGAFAFCIQMTPSALPELFRDLLCQPRRAALLCTTSTPRVLHSGAFAHLIRIRRFRVPFLLRTWGTPSRAILRDTASRSPSWMLMYGKYVTEIRDTQKGRKVRPSLRLVVGLNRAADCVTARASNECVGGAYACGFCRFRKRRHSRGRSHAYTRLRLASGSVARTRALNAPQRRTLSLVFSYAAHPVGEPPMAAYEKRHPKVSFAVVVGLNRLELSTSRLSGVCSNQLSYNP